MAQHEFTAWPKTARLFRDSTITEKLDGTNSGIHVSRYDVVEGSPAGSYTVDVDGTRYVVSAQSRKRIITPGKTTDNYGFAGWVYDNAEHLVRLLGEGLHYGEWWGKGIQRSYGLDERRFSLFNTHRFATTHALVGDVLLSRVPVLYQGPFSEEAVTNELRDLRTKGSLAAPGFMDPEGVCVYHSAVGKVFKVTLDNNDAGKWEA